MKIGTWKKVIDIKYTVRWEKDPINRKVVEVYRNSENAYSVFFTTNMRDIPNNYTNVFLTKKEAVDYAIKLMKYN